MKKLLSFLFLLVAVFSLAACQGVVYVDSLQVSGQKTEFVLGEEFETGQMTVIAVYTNGNEEDVTAKAKVTPSTDMSAAGNYSVKVYYEGCEAEYNIRIEQPQLTNLELKHVNVDKNYLIGESLDLAGLEVVAHYTNSITGATQSVVEDYEVVVENSKGVEVKGAFEYVGDYTVTISYGELSQSFSVAVANNYATVAEAVEAGIANAHKVASGTYTYGDAEYSTTQTYAFGENYFTYYDGYTTYHYSEKADGTILGAGVEEGGYVSAYGADPEIMLGCQDYVLYYSVAFQGAEGLVSALYNLAVESGAEVSESAVEGAYSFAYNYTLVEDYGDGWVDYYYYNIAVSFKLGDGAEFKSVEYVQTQYYAEQLEIAEDGSWTVVEGQVSENVYEYEFVQVAGERNIENPYSEDKVAYKSFDLVDYAGELAPTEYNIKIGEPVVLCIGNALPETASDAFNDFTFVCENPDLEMEYSAYVSFGEVKIYVYSEGTYVITMSTGSIEKTITIVATEPSPESIATYAYEEVEQWFGPELVEVEASEITLEAGQSAYFKVAIFPEKANQEYTYEFKEATEAATVAESDNSDWNAPYDSMTFSASEAGTYVVVFTSVKNPELKAELTFVVTESVKEPVTLEGKWAGEWTHPMLGTKAKFDLELREDGTATLACPDGFVAELAYVVEGSSIAFTATNEWVGSIEGCTFDLLNGEMVATFYVNEYDWFPSVTLHKVVETEVEGTLVGQWKGTFLHPMFGLPCNATIEFFADGTGSGVFNGEPVDFTYADLDGMVSFAGTNSEFISFTIGSYTEGYEELTIFVFFNGQQTNATLTK